QVPGAVAGRVQRRDLETPGGDDVAVADVAGDAGHAGRLELVRQHPRAEALDDHARLVDVGAVRVGDEQVRHGQALDVGRVDQRCDRPAGVDDAARPARLVADEVGVRQPPRVHAALEDHDDLAARWAALWARFSAWYAVSASALSTSPSVGWFGSASSQPSGR